MEILAILTIIYGAVLVAAVAITVPLILAALVRIKGVLAQIASGLNVVQRQTAPLEAHLGAINEGLSAINDGLQSVEGHLVAADGSLGKVADRLEAGQPVS